MSKGILFSNGVVSGLSRTLLSKEIYNRLIECKSKQEILDLLSETTFSSVFENVELSSQEALNKEMTNLLNFVREESPSKEFTEFFLLPFDFQNILSFCKCSLFGLDFDEIAEIEGQYTFPQIKDWIGSQDYKKFNNKFISLALLEIDKLKDSGTFESWEIDLIFKRYLFKALVSVAKNSTLKYILARTITLENVSVASRAKTQFELESQILVGGELKKDALIKIFNKDKNILGTIENKELAGIVKLALSENSQDKFVKLEKMKNALAFNCSFVEKDKVESIAPFVYFCYGKLIDIKNVRLILSYHENNLSQEIAKRILRVEK